MQGKDASKVIKFCGSQHYLMRKNFDYNELKSKLAKQGIKDFGNSFLFRTFTIFKDSRILIKAKDEKEALSSFSKYIGN